MKTTLEWALFYRLMGFSIIPVKITEIKNGKANKKPLIVWGEFQNRIASEEEIRNWYNQWPDAGIGLVTGKISGIFALDVDLGGDTKNLNLPLTVESETGSGGSHYLFKYRDGIKNSSNQLGPKLDIRGEGGFIVLPPTKYTGNSSYEWVNSPETTEIAEAPEELIKALSNGGNGSNTVSFSPNKAYQKETVLEGEGRNNAAASFAGRLLIDLEEKHWEGIGWLAMRHWNQAVCLPPLNAEELAATFNSLMKKESERRKKDSIKSNFPKSEDSQKKEIYIQLKKDFFYTDKNGKQKVSPSGIQSIAAYFVANYHVKTIGDYRNREIYLYKNGKYDEQGANFFHAEIEKILGESCNIHFQSEIIDKIKNLTFIEREAFKIAEEYLNFANGVYNFKTNELTPHDPKHYFMHQIPVNYDPKADCPEIKKFFAEIFEPKDLPVIQEWIGYLLYRQYFIKKALILFGVGNSGKTTFINILTKFIGQENIAGVSLQKIGGDKFATASLYDKHVNLYDDLSSNDISENGMFKIVTGGGLIPAEHKYGDYFNFWNYAKLVFACNKIPSPKDTDDDAYFDRWVLINLTKTILKDKREPFISQRLTTEIELSGLLNFGLEGLRRITRGWFSYEKETYEVKMEMLKSNSSIAQFSFECLEKQYDTEISKDSLYEAYCQFCGNNDIGIETKDMFGKSLIKFVGYAVDGWITDKITQKRARGWRNVRIKELP